MCSSDLVSKGSRREVSIANQHPRLKLDEDGRQTANSRSNIRYKELPGGSPAVVCLPAGCPVLAAVGFRQGKKTYIGETTPMAPRNGLYRSDTGAPGTFARRNYPGATFGCGFTGLEAEEVSAQLTTLVPGRRVADNATVALRLTGGVPGRLWASMAATGQVHGLRIRVFGELGSLEWVHEDPQHLVLRHLDGTEVRLAQGLPGLSADEARLNRVGLGHAEGFIEAFANYYSDIAEVLYARRDGHEPPHRELSYPTGADGVAGLLFVEAVTASSAANSAWVRPEKAGK